MATRQGVSMNARPHLSSREFGLFQDWLLSRAGIHLSSAKVILVQSRLAKRLERLNLHSYGDYFHLIISAGQEAERQHAIDLLTTNETHFFREPAHFDFLRETVLGSAQTENFRVWSAASSSGEEPYSIAMTLAARLGGASWEVVASDISMRVLEQAKKGQYAMARSEGIPNPYLKRFCLKGVGSQDGTFLVKPELRSRVHFLQVNLNLSLPALGEFDVIFLRNVMIYFNQETKREVVKRVSQRLRPGGYLFVGHSESLNGVASQLKAVRPAVYQLT